MFAKLKRAWTLAAIVFVLVLSAPGVGAQEERSGPAAPRASGDSNPAPPAPRRLPKPGDVAKVFVLKHAVPRQLAQLLEVFPATISYATSGPFPNSAIGVSAAPAVMVAIEETIKRLDVPPAHTRSVETTGYVLEALSQAAASSQMPLELEPVVAQLRRTFNYAGYRLVDRLVARGTEGSGFSTQGGRDASAKSSYSLHASWIELVPGDGGAAVRLHGLVFEAQVPVSGQVSGVSTAGGHMAGVHADISIGPGQKVVVGKSGVGDPDGAIILVLSAKVED